MNSIASVCLMARANFEDSGEIYRLWRYVNAMHCTAYCGLTDHLTEANFFTPLSKKHPAENANTAMTEVRAPRVSVLQQ